MRLRVLALLGLVCLVAYHYCGGEPAKTSATVVATPAAITAIRNDPNRLDRVILRAAMARLRKVDIAAGDLRLEGQAVDDKKQPIAGATITLDGVRTTVSEQDGSFAFDDLAKGDYELAAERGRMYGEDTVSLDDTSDPLILTLRYGPTLVVHVVDHAGTPQLGVKIDASTIPVLTDAAGKASVRGMELGVDRVHVSKLGFASQTVRIDVGDDITRTVDKKIVLQPAAPIGGLVLDQDGKPVADARVTAQLSTWSDQADTDATGHWKLDGFGAGNVTLTAWSDVDVSRPDPPISLDGTTPRMDLVVRVDRGATIGGLVTDAAGKPLADVHVQAGASTSDSDEHGRFLIAGIDPVELVVQATTQTLGAPTQTITVKPASHTELAFVMVDSTISGTVTNGHGQPVADVTIIATGSATNATQTDEFGHFDFGGMPPGDYTLNATRASEPTSVAPEVPAHTGEHRVALVVPDEATITGRIVMNGAPVDYFGTFAAPSSEKPEGQPDPVYANDGRFSISGLRPGSFTVEVVGPAFQRLMTPNVTVTAGATIDLGDIEVTPGRKLHGRIVDGGGAPIADASIVVEQGTAIDAEVSLRNSTYGAQTAHSDATGHFEIAGLPDDLAGYTIQANAEVGVVMPRELAPADLDREVELVIAQTGSVVATIVNLKNDEQFLGRLLGSGDIGYREMTSDGQITFDHVPAGDYMMVLDYDMIVAPIAVHVAPDQVTQVSITRPDTFISLDVAIEGDTCSGITLTAAGVSRDLDFAQCDNPHHALLEHLTPGTYTVCNTSCTTIEVTPSPSRQSATIVEQPSSDEPSPSPSQAEDPIPSQGPAAEVDPPADPDEAASTAD
ncbi:MAG TPA: carboxypeptidase-like regulatory domain-containing protein [Kofleriaceae bacterium]|jgi:protocatechuate 3,4-dioxygenase beta subunit